VKNLTKTQIRDIYSGKITNWAELGGDDAEIIAYQRNEYSGSQSYMNEFMGETPLVSAPKTMVISEMWYMVETIADYKNGKYAIGYSVYSYAASKQVSAGNVAFVAVDGVLPDRESFTNGSYPLLSQTMLYYNKENADEITLNFCNWLVSDEGQKTVLEAGFLPAREIEIPAIYEVYKDRGTGKVKTAGKPDKYAFFYLSTDNLGSMNILKNKELEAEIDAFIIDAFGEKTKEDYCIWSIYNGYLSLHVSPYLSPDYYAVWDLFTGEKIENFSDLFYKDTDIAPIVDERVLYYIESAHPYGLMQKCDYFGFLGEIKKFNADEFLIGSENPYFITSKVINSSLVFCEDSIISEYRDFSHLVNNPEIIQTIAIPPYKRDDFIINEPDNYRHYYQIRWDEKTPEEVEQINAALIKACDNFYIHIEEIDGLNQLDYNWDFELTENGIRFYTIYYEMIFDSNGNYVETNNIQPPLWICYH
jgi:hypothetical protein